jgi:hypothetical protein
MKNLIFEKVPNIHRKCISLVIPVPSILSAHFFTVIIQILLHIQQKCQWSDKYGSMSSQKCDLWIKQRRNKEKPVLLTWLLHAWCSARGNIDRYR